MVARVDVVADELVLRRLLWLNHGHSMLYGDDGEMQCGRCLLDFKRDTVERIECKMTQAKRRGALC